jgi:hypothetical protein
MSLGFAPYLLKHSKAVFQGIAPSTKITPVGFTRMLLENTKPNIVSSGIDDGSGHIKDMKIKYRTRLPKGKSQTTDNCDIDARPAYAEATISATMFRKYAVMLEDETIAKYEKEASALLAPGGASLSGVSPLMQEQWDVIMETINGLMQDINDDLVVKQVTNFGVNQTNGLATAKTVNFPLSTATNVLTAGMTMVMADARANEMNIGNTVIVGSGLIDNYYIQHNAGAIGQGENGVNQNRLALPKFYHDFDCASGWGANQFGIFEKNSVQLIDINRYTGFKAGNKGGDFFGSLTVPVLDAQGNMVPFTFDIQLTYIKCPTELVIGGYGAAQTVNRGWALIISKSFDSFNIPADAYHADDRLYGNNGTLRYTATNA